ncbi:MAG TPA: GNAT family N-acetyltransferase [Gaiellaceae bacterium]|nr:GNAT family N-acetyltransferase [Gaiellaceae bacterium]
MVNVELRPVRPDESDELYRGYRESALVAYAHVFPPELYRFPDDDVRQMWRELVSENGRRHQLFVAEVDGEILGAIVATPETLEHLFVVPSYWGTGVADTLHDAAVALSRASGADVCRLEVLEENWRARRFYQRHSWVRDERRSVAHYPPQLAVVGYTLSL